MMKKLQKRLLGLALALVMAFTLLPANMLAAVLAAEVNETDPAEDDIVAPPAAENEDDPLADDTIAPPDGETDPVADDIIAPPDGETDPLAEDVVAPPIEDGETPDDDSAIAPPADPPTETATDGLTLAIQSTSATPPAWPAAWPARNYGGGRFLAQIGTLADGSIAIGSRAELAEIGVAATHPLNGAYHLTADIDLSDSEWTPLGGTTSAFRFTGILDGQGHKITGLTLTDSSSNAGLFAALDTATVRNLGFEDNNINVSRGSASGPPNVGAICGSSYGATTIENCYNMGDLAVELAGLASIYAGGLVGSSSGAITIRDSYNMGNISAYSPDAGTSYAAGIVGHLTVSGTNAATISGCYNIGQVSATAASVSTSSGTIAGGICGYLWASANASVTVSGCGNGGAVYAGFASSAYNNTTAYAGGICGEARTDNGALGNILLEIVGCRNEGDVSVSAAKVNVGGILGSHQSLGDTTIAQCQNSGAVTFARPEDHPAVSDSGFACAGGIFGSGYKLQLADCTNSGNVSSTIAAGGIGGWYRIGDSGACSIGNCGNSGTVTASSSRSGSLKAGGILGTIEGMPYYNSFTLTIENSHNTEPVTAATTYAGPAYAGGICGAIDSSLKTLLLAACTNAGAVSAASGYAANAAGNNSSAGGIVGFRNSTLSGGSDATFNDCRNMEAVTSPRYAGGILGYNGHSSAPSSLVVEDCRNSGEIAGVAAAGICGYSNGSANQFNYFVACGNEGPVTATSAGMAVYAAGILGDTDTNAPLDISDCYNTATAIILATTTAASEAATAAGICARGSAETVISDCRNEGGVSAASVSEVFGGGILGNTQGAGSLSLTRSSNSGAVLATSTFTGSARDAFAGGVCGRSANNGTISDCYSTGAVSASTASRDAYAGGVLGYSAGGSPGLNLSTAYGAGSVSATAPGNAFAGGLCGYRAASGPGMVNIVSCYWNSEMAQTVNGTARAGADRIGVGFGTDSAVPRTSAQMRVQTSFAGFDFDEVWGFSEGVNNGWPVLGGESPGETGEAKEIHLTISHNPDGSEPVMIITYYAHDGQLKSVVLEDIPVDTDAIKIMIWSGLNTMEAKMPAVTVE
ncbi:MAG: hypothetical protein LBI54_08470 [Lachnospiraceae bacterium]|nr:hypothetical protein [Lachnospiraceae bacterium]